MAAIRVRSGRAGVKRAGARAKPPAKARAKPRRAAKTARRTAPRRGAGALSARRSDVAEVTKAELASLRRELEKARGAGPARWNADPDDVQRSVARLVLALVEFLRKLMERQAIRRMEAGTLDAAQI